ncbi:hypothetical protein H0H92_000343 [Tricholoma furcatifolium]|nr:hypothetical protein H0H92_000343 [Tricholoma furcatifolium]
MLAVNETPRPRPPAKIRRSSAALASTPPPSYAAAFTLTPDGKPHILGSPIIATLQRVGWESERQMSPTKEEDRDWMNEKSREELTDLLVKADDLIKERETELGVASAVCKSLYDNNLVLKSKHQQLLSRLPSSPSPSPEPVLHPSSRYSVSLNRPAAEYDSPMASKHARKISVSTADFSNLADQNAELLEKLERIESESLNADQSGRRALKRLEKEIQTLREELEKTQARSEELEQKTNAKLQSQKAAQDALMRKEEMKLRALRDFGYADEDEDEEVRDFAPESSTFGGPRSFYPSSETPRRSSGPLKRPPAPPAPLTPHPESKLIAQLLEKIQELEETNVRIISQQNETSNQLNAMQRETEHISRVYECLADANFVEANGDSVPRGGGEPTSYDETIRFKSFARNLAAEYSSSPNADDVYQPLSLSTVPRVRKSVVGLFEGHDNLENSRGGSTPEQLKSFNLPIPFASPEGHHKSLTETGLASPALSSHGLSPSRAKIGQRTLETELGNAFDDGWAPSDGHYHRRNNSLYDLSPISTPVSPSPLSANASFEQSRNIGSPYEQRDALPTPMSMSSGTSALRLSVEPPTPDKVATAGKAQTTGSVHSLRHLRMTETLRSRTSRWADNRFKDSLTGKLKVEVSADDYEGQREQREEAGEEEVTPPSTPLPMRLASAFDAAVEEITGPPVYESDDEGQGVVSVSGSKVQKAKSKGFGAVMLELWLWLQFAVIILVFLWAMARRGPKSVLGDVGGHRRSRTMSLARR